MSASLAARVLVAAVLLVSFAAPLGAWNHTEIEWRTIKTEHFEIHYHPGAEWSAGQVARIVEEVYIPITGYYGYEPGTIHINIYDIEDVSSGATFYYLNRIDISAEDLDFHLRGNADWLNNVITHEFTHMVSIQQAMKLPFIVPSVYFQVISFEKEKRPDVLTGYPNFQASFPLISGEVVPNWLSEGTAQYQCRLARNDIWDSHRDMLLRTAALGGKLLSIDELGVFGKNSLNSEMVYNQGFSMVRYISERFGYEKVADLMQAHSRLRRINFNGASKQVLGISGNELYRMWREEIETHYGREAARITPSAREGESIAGKGFMNLFPVRDRRTGVLYYLSNRGGDYSDLGLVRRGNDGKVKSISSNVRSSFSLSPDGCTLCYAKRTKKNRYGYTLNDIHLYDLKARKERRLTRSLRATDPSWSPGGDRIACVLNRDGSERVALVSPSDGSFEYLTDPVPGRQYFGLSWGSGGILASRFDGISRDIVLIDPVSGSEGTIIASPADERDPCWTVEGEGFLYASDRTGIFNIYYHRLHDGSGFMVTNVIGGAFQPAVSGMECVFTGFGPDGYGIRTVSGWKEGSKAIDASADNIDLMLGRLTCIAGDSNAEISGMTETQRNRLYLSAVERRLQPAGGPQADTGKSGEPSGDKAEYENFGIKYTPIYVFPRFLFYEGKPRVGVFFDTRDMLDRQAVFAGGAVSFDGEFDLNLGIEIRQFKPTFTFDVYRTRKFYEYYSATAGKVDTRYDLWDAYFACKFELRPSTPFHRKEFVLQYNHGEYGLNIEAWDVLDSEIGWTYYKADEFSLLFHYRNISEGVDADINPRGGRIIDVEVTRAYDKLSSGDFDYALYPIYDTNPFGRYMLNYEEFLPVPLFDSALSLKLMGGAIDNSQVDEFFYLYLGSRDGLRGYTYYSLGGRKIAMARATLRFPIIRSIHRQILSVYIASLYGAVFVEAGKAWDEDEFDFNGNKKDVGFELRMKGFTFYNYPLAVSFEAAYGLNDITYTDPFNIDQIFYEGEKWKYYGSVLFNF